MSKEPRAFALGFEARHVTLFQDPSTPELQAALPAGLLH